ncbi:M23 family metallopeptidase [Corynebacterium mendelii]|uniref:M23 family metallopeptidase n=1 Tax=Corynebacterium mendelii TaxID=2765362 RepID=A0A939DZQ3_9CORY|nr:M23 family metallopeptidase [Corynebacterium mendelii]MBN9643203.1 M23 family metallopeptidase [Corynebacterium mendelii]
MNTLHLPPAISRPHPDPASRPGRPLSGRCHPHSRWLHRLAALLLVVLVAAAPGGAVAAAAVPRTAAAGGGWVNPVTSFPGRPVVVRDFDPPARRWLAGHRGVDVAAAPGQPIYAAGAGTVRFAGFVALTPTVSIRHPGGIITTYQPVKAAVAAGQPVSAGQLIGQLSEPVTVWPGLSWGARLDGVYINPVHLLDRPPIRLKTRPTFIPGS